MGLDTPTDDEHRGASASAEPPRDVAFVYARSEDGEGLDILRHRGDRLEVGRLRSVRPGRPIHGEVVRLRERPEHGQLFDVDVLYASDRGDAGQATPQRTPAARATQAPPGRPALVNSGAYRTNWDRIFGRPGDGEANGDLN